MIYKRNKYNYKTENSTVVVNHYILRRVHTK